MPFAITAVYIFYRTGRRWAGEWNPARRYLLAGFWLGLIGLIEFISAAFWLALYIVTQTDL
jgi:hypothetical protein